MLVLSRRENDRVLFPSLGISIQVVRLTSGRVSLGIQAPQQIQVIRQELHGESEPQPDQSDLVAAMEAQVRRRMEGKVNSIARSLELARNELEQGRTASAVRRLERVRSQLDALRSTAGEQASGNSESSAQDSATNGGTRDRGQADSGWRVGDAVSESTPGYSIGADEPPRRERFWVANGVRPSLHLESNGFRRAASASDQSASVWEAKRTRW